MGNANSKITSKIFAAIEDLCERNGLYGMTFITCFDGHFVSGSVVSETASDEQKWVLDHVEKTTSGLLNNLGNEKIENYGKGSSDID